MSTTGDRARTLCLGEALVDLICERPIDDLAQADSFSPHLGGVVANVAVAAARCGAPVALAGGAGDDSWGRWLRDRLRDEGVDVSRFALIDGSQTPLAVASVDADGEPTYEVYGQPLPTVVAAVGDDVADAVVESAALFVSSNTLVGAQERSVTMRAVEAARATARPVVVDPNIRLHRWGSPASAADAVNACVPGALLIRANEEEAALMTGEADPDRAAAALVRGRRPDRGDHARSRGGDPAGRGARRRPGGAGRRDQHDRRRGRADRHAAGRPRRRGVLAGRGGRGAARRRRGGSAGLRAVGGARMSPRKSDWKQPPPRRVRAIRDRLRLVYGIPQAQPHRHPIAELILTVLSQSTNDRNRDVAYLALRERFPDDTWAAVRDAPVDEIEEAIRPGGISKVKSARIKSILRAITDTAPGMELSLDWLPELSVPEAQAYLTSLPGVGRKTAACVLLFALGMRDIPVDTHVSRVGTPPGHVPPRGSVRGAPRHDARDHAAGRGARAAPEPAAPRAADVSRAAAELPRLRAAADVPERRGVPGVRDQRPLACITRQIRRESRALTR